MDVKNLAQPVRQIAYAGTASGVNHTQEKKDSEAAGTAYRTDTMTISAEARRAVMVDELEKDDLDHVTAQKLLSGKLTVNEPDWETFKLPTLEAQVDSKIYQNAYFQSYAKTLGEISRRVDEHYQPELSKIKGMEQKDALDYLFKTYKLPWMSDVFIDGTDLPSAPNGMSKEESYMAYDQLKGMRFGNGHATLRDQYALGADGLEKLDNISKNAHEAAQKVYEAAQKELAQEQETWKAQQMERHKAIYTSLRDKASTGLGYMALGTEAAPHNS